MSNYPSINQMDRTELDEFIKVINNILKYITEKELTELRGLNWYLIDDQIISSWGRKAQKVFTLNGVISYFIEYFPVNPVYLLISLLTFLLEPFYAPLYRYINIVGYPPFFPNNIILGIVLLFFIFLLVANVFGAYWSLFIVINNKQVSTILRVIVPILVFVVLGIWLINGAPIYWENLVSDSNDFSNFIEAYPITTAYRIMATFFFYLPVFIYFVLGFVGTIYFFALCVKVLFTWFFKFQLFQTTQNISQFIYTPIYILSSTKQNSFLELGIERIHAIDTWAKSRIDTVQLKLIPATLLLAFSAVITSTTIGDQIVKIIKFAVDIVFITPYQQRSLPNPIHYFLFLLVLLILLLPLPILVALLCHSYVACYLHEACIIAEYALIRSTNQEAEQRMVNSKSRRKRIIKRNKEKLLSKLHNEILSSRNR